MIKRYARCMSVLAVVVVVMAFSVPVSAFEVGVIGYYEFPEFSGTLRVDQGGVAGTELDAEDDLGMSNESYPSVEAFFGVGSHHVRVKYTQADYSGENTIQRNITYNGQAYASGTFVESELNFTMIDVEYQYDLIDLENILAGFSVGLVGKVKYIDGETRLRATGAGLDEQETFSAPIPMVGASLHVGLLADILEARAKVAGMAYSDSTFYEGMAEVTLTPFPFLDIHGGYRYMKLDLDDFSDVYADVEFKGPYAGITVGF
jgi:outer membrane protein